MNEMSPKTAKLFWTGRSQAVRLPKDFRFEGSEVRIRREADGSVNIAPSSDDGDWIERLAGTMDMETAQIIREDRPGPETLPEWAHLK